MPVVGHEDAAQPGDTCCICQRTFFDGGGRREIPFAMDLWDEDVPILGARAGEAVWFLVVVCNDCATTEGKVEEALGDAREGS